MLHLSVFRHVESRIADQRDCKYSRECLEGDDLQSNQCERGLDIVAALDVLLPQLECHDPTQRISRGLHSGVRGNYRGYSEDSNSFWTGPAS